MKGNLKQRNWRNYIIHLNSLHRGTLAIKTNGSYGPYTSRRTRKKEKTYRKKDWSLAATENREKRKLPVKFFSAANNEAAWTWVLWAEVSRAGGKQQVYAGGGKRNQTAAPRCCTLP